ncbi:coiled-coil domain-containing protein 86 [Myotis lucifugus]|uniref:coiled-coil domain-containing protein 86 n=1 Tax=Myotis lucifugus TaxID=59463 RepID=UPI0003C46C21|nr:coiled-coil domain-containing protein 86 [Myotis lucifugus]
MDTPLRRSRRLGGPKAELPESPTAAPRARRALAEFESSLEETREPASPRRVRQPGLESPRRQPETRPGSPSLGQGAGLGSPRREPGPGPGSPQGQQGPGLESPRRQPASSPERPRREPKPSGESPQVLGSRGGPGARVAPGAEELSRRPLQHQPSGPGSPEPHPGQQAPGPEPSPPPQELAPQPPGAPRGQRLPSQPPPARELARDGLCPKERTGPSAQAPAPKKRKEEAEVPIIPKGKPKSGRVWKDRAKKRFSQMVQDKPLRTSWRRKVKERQERKLAKDFARHLEEEKERCTQEKKQRRAENLKRRLENERKAEIVQVIRNPAKLKRAKKKQLRSIEKRDTLALLQQPPRPAAKV